MVIKDGECEEGWDHVYMSKMKSSTPYYKCILMTGSTGSEIALGNST